MSKFVSFGNARDAIVARGIEQREMMKMTEEGFHNVEDAIAFTKEYENVLDARTLCTEAIMRVLELPDEKFRKVIPVLAQRMKVAALEAEEGRRTLTENQVIELFRFV